MTKPANLSANSSRVKKRSHSDSELSCHLEFDRLRQLLFEDEQQSLQELSDRINSKERRADDVSEVLADSFRRITDDGNLVSAMAPSFGKSFSECVNSEPELIADAVSPIIGPAIRQSISRALKAMVQSTNQAMEISLSPQGLRWRIEALRTGKSFAEVVLLHTLVFRVQQIFLIHRKTGLLLHHVSSTDEGGADSDMVSGMLTAIQDFVNDSFGQQDSDLDSIRVGENTIWIDCEQQTVLAAVIEGEPPESLRVTLAEAHEAIRRQLGQEIANFSGDTSEFAKSENHLQPCLVTQTKKADDKKKQPPFALIACAAIGLILASVFGWWWYSSSQHQKAIAQREMNWAETIAKVEAEPGISITRFGETDGQFYLFGMRDDLARLPQNVLAGLPIGSDEIEQHWSSYLSTDKPIVAARVRNTLRVPTTVKQSANQNGIVLEGAASDAWIERAKRIVDDGIFPVSIDLSGVVNVDAPWLDFVAQLRSTPGYVVISAKRVGDRYLIEGLRDPAADRLSELDESSELLNKIDFRWKPYVDTSDVMEQRRIQQKLDPPATVKLNFNAGQLIVVGEAHHWWIDTLKEYAERSVAIKQVDFAELVDIELRSYQNIKSEIQSTAILFQGSQYDASNLSKRESDALDEVAIQFRRAIELSQKLDKQIHLVIAGPSNIVIDGRASAADDIAYAKRLSRIHADTVASELVRTGIPRNKLKTKGLESTRGKSPRRRTSDNNRSVTFTILEI